MNPGTSLSFNITSLQTANILTDTIDHHGWPDVNVKQYPLAHANKSVIPYEEWPSRTISITGTIFGSSISDLDSRIDSFKYALLGVDQNLDIGYNGTTRRYIATVSKVAIQRPGGLAFGKFSVDFACNNPFGQDTTSTTALTASGRTLATYNDTYTFLGTAPFQQPIITLTYTAVSATGTQSVIVGNASTGQQITVSRSGWATGDVIVIDTTQKTVTVNGVSTTFTGAFPAFAPGAGTLTYTDSFTSRTFTILATYTVLYL